MALQMTKKISTLSVTAALLKAILHNVQSGGVHVSAINAGGRSVLPAFSVTCAYNDGSERYSVKILSGLVAHER